MRSAAAGNFPLLPPDAETFPPVSGRIDEDERRLIRRPFCRINAFSIGEIKQSAQVVEGSLIQQAVHVGKGGAEVGAAASNQGKVLQKPG